jgi:hypothetical protein
VTGLEIHHRVTGIGVRIPGPPPLLKHLHSIPFFEQDEAVTLARGEAALLMVGA